MVYGLINHLLNAEVDRILNLLTINYYYIHILGIIRDPNILNEQH